MSKINAGIIDFALYENGSEFLGVARVTMPNIQRKTITVSGAGVLGDLEVPVPGQASAMSATIEFIDSPEAAYKLNDAKMHLLDLRVAHEDIDGKVQALKARGFKHVINFMPKTMTGGTVAPASAQGSSVEGSVLSIKTYIDGKCVQDFDPLNYRSVGSDGVDEMSEIKKILGR